MKKIILTGGGTAGHVTPNLALVPALKKDGYDIHYIGSHDGIERTLCEKEGIPYHPISTGKFRRYLSLKNLTDPFKVIAGFFNSMRIIKQIHPNVIFSKGGFVSVPVAIAGKLRRVPVILHESDMTPGLANKICAPFSKAVCATFPETMEHLNQKKARLTGSPIRSALFAGDAEKGFALCGFQEQKPTLLMIGGSLGAQAINQVLRQDLERLIQRFNIIHICGKGNVDKDLQNPSYAQFEFVGEDLAHLFALADIVVSRAGANAIFELLSLKKPALLIPLTKKSSRGDQILNAQNFKEKGYSMVLPQEEMTPDTLYDNLIALYENKDAFIAKMEAANPGNGVENVLNVIYSYARPESSK